MSRGAGSDLWARGVAIAKSVSQRFGQHRMPTHAAALAYRGALAVFPFLLLVFGFVHAVGLASITDALAERVARGRFNREGALAEWFADQVDAPPDTGLLSIGIITALWAVATGIRGLQLALADAAAVADPGKVPFWRKVAVSLLFAPLAVLAFVLVASSLLITSQSIKAVTGWFGVGESLADLISWLRVPVALLAITLLVATAYRLTPGTRASLRSILPVALLVAVSWTVMSLGFSIALATVLDYGATYGSFGAAIGLLVYFYFSATIMLLGAELNAALREDAARARRPGDAG